MNIFDRLKRQIKGKNKQLIFPEATDERVLRAVTRLSKEKLLMPILIGKKQKIDEVASSLNLDISSLQIIDPQNFPGLLEMAQALVDCRQQKLTLTEAKVWLQNQTYFATMLVYLKQADGIVSGAAHSTADTVRPALQIIKTRPGQHRVSGAFIMEKGAQQYIFADCAMNLDPTASELAEIAYQSAQTAKLAGLDPKIAMLSFSTKGSAKGEMVQKMQEATQYVHERYPDLKVDGELQFDAALIAQVGARKAPDSKVAGHANVFIFPELQSGNIGYKIAQRLGGFTAIGPILQGLNAPINDLSRGASDSDIYHAGILTAAQAILER